MVIWDGSWYIFFWFSKPLKFLSISIFRAGLETLLRWQAKLLLLPSLLLIHFTTELFHQYAEHWLSSWPSVPSCLQLETISPRLSLSFKIANIPMEKDECSSVIATRISKFMYRLQAALNRGDILTTQSFRCHTWYMQNGSIRAFAEMGSSKTGYGTTSDISWESHLC